MIIWQFYYQMNIISNDNVLKKSNTQTTLSIGTTPLIIKNC